MDNKSKNKKSKPDSAKSTKRLGYNIDPNGCYQTTPPVIKVEQVLGANMAQRVLEMDLIVPERKPDIEQIVDVYVKNLKVTSLDIIRDQVIIRGSLDVKVMYVADLPNQPVHAFEKKNVRFTRDIEVLGAEPNMKANADVVTEFIDYDRDCEARSVHVTIVLKMWARVMDTLGIELYSETGVMPTAYKTLGVAAGTLNEEVELGEIEQPVETPIEIPVEEIEQPEELEEMEEIEEEEELEELEEELEELEEEEEEIEEEIAETEEEIEEIEVTPPAAIMKVKGRVVNVRNGPGTNFPVVTQVKRGDTVIIRDQAFGWYKVTLSDGQTTGWIASWLLTPPKG